MKKKGYSLIMAIISVGIVSILAAAIAAVATTSFTNTVFKEKQYKLRLMAESAVEREFYYIKKYVTQNTDFFNNPSSLDINTLKNMSKAQYQVGTGTDKINCKVSVSTNTGDADRFYDAHTGRYIDYIQIEARVQYVNSSGDTTGNGVGLRVKVDKSSFNNDYFDRIFRGSFTTAPNNITSDLMDSSFTSAHNSIKVSGNAFLQGNVSLSPNTLNMSEGDITAVTNSLNNLSTNVNFSNPNDSLSNVNLRKYQAVKAAITDWKEGRVNKLPLSKILYHSNLNPQAAESQDLTSDDDIDSGSIQQIADDVKIMTYKAKGMNNIPINFQKLIDGKNLDLSSGIYWKIIQQLKVQNPGSKPEDIYGQYYKLLLIDGDIVIDDDNKEDFNNYLIYCTGTVTFQGKAYFYNSSIFANKIVLNGDVEFNGVGTSNSKAHTIGGFELQDFSAEYKGAINKYLTDNLEKYGDYLKFKVLSWENL